MLGFQSQVQIAQAQTAQAQTAQVQIIRIQAYVISVLMGAMAVTFHDMHQQAARAIAFNINSQNSMPDWAVDGVLEASSLWESVVTDDVTVNLDFRFEPLSGDTLGFTDTTEQTYQYQQVYQALSSDKSSSFDASATQNLPTGDSFDLLINYTNDSPEGSGSPVPYLDANQSLNNQRIRLTMANARALNLSGPLSTTGSGTDATITLNSTASWDADRTNGISNNTYDFVGVAAHEIGHALGFISGADFLDESSPFSSNGQDFFFPEDTFTTVSPLDLFRFSNESVSYGSGVIDWTANNTDKYFSIDGGASMVRGTTINGQNRPARFSTGLNHGNGESSSHWKPDLGLGLMQPRLNQGDQLDLSELDLIAFDVMGWDISASASQFFSDISDVSEPLPISEDDTDAVIPADLLPSGEGSSNDESSNDESSSNGNSSNGLAPLPFEMAIASTAGEATVTPPNINASRLTLRAAQTSTSTEIPESSSILGFLLAIAGFGVTSIYKHSQSARSSAQEPGFHSTID